MRKTLWVTVVGLGLIVSAVCTADTLLVAVASNFKPTARLLADQFQTNNAIDVQLSSASTGVLFAQIRQGAPFDVFLAADSRHVQALQEAGLIQADTLMTYAVGQLVLVSDNTTTIDNDLVRTLQNLRTSRQRIAIANPSTAPYGHAARETLTTLGLWQDKDKRLIRANNVAQSLQYVAARTVSAAFAAKSLLQQSNLPDDLAIITVPANLHTPITQQAAVLRQSAHTEQAKAFIQFLQTDTARTLISENGYALPDRALE